MPKKTNDKNDQNDKNKKNNKVTAPKPTPEQRKERARAEHLEDLEATAKARTKTENRFINHYGPHGSVMIKSIESRYTNMVIKPPEDLSPGDVSLVVLGSCMRDEWTDRAMTSSSFTPGSMTVKEFNREFLVSGILNEDKRTGYFPSVLVEGRYQANQAIEAYKKGDPSRMVEMVDDVCNFAIRGLKTHTFYPASSIIVPTSNEYSEGKGLLLMTGRILEKEPFKSGSKIPPEERAKLIAYSHLAESQSELVTRKIALMKEPPKPNTREREDQVAEFLFHEYLSNTLNHASDEKMTLQTELMRQVMERCAINRGSSEYTRLMSKPELIASVGMDLLNLVKTQRVTDLETILAAPDYKEKFRSLYMDEIRKTDHYKKLVSADGNEFKDALMETEGKVRKGFAAFSGVKLNGEAAAFNQAMQPAFDAELNRLTDHVNSYAEEKAVERNQVEKYDAEGTRRIKAVADGAWNDFIENLPKSQLVVKKVGKETDITPKVTDPRYKGVFETLKDLCLQAEDFHNLGKKNKVKQKQIDSYSKQLDLTISAVDDYFRKNPEIPEEAEAKAAHFSMIRVRRGLNGQKIGMNLRKRRDERVADTKKLLTSKAPITAKEIDPLVQRVKSEMEMERFGADDMKKRLQDKAVTATERLGGLISKEGELTPEEAKEAKSLMKDIFNYRLLTTMKNQAQARVVIPLDQLIPGVTDRIPEFRKETAHLTKAQLIQFAFGEKSEDIIGVGRDGFALDPQDPRIRRRDEIENYFGDEQNSQSKVVTDQIDAKIKERDDELMRMVQRQAVVEYMKNVEGLSKDHDHVERRFHQVYGSKPQMFDTIKLHEEYNELTIDPPPELDENTVTAIVLGSIMQSDVLKVKACTSSFQSGTTTFLDFNQNFITANILSETPDFDRQGSTALAMVEGRKKAIEAIEEYKQGKPERAKGMIETLINFGVSAVNSAQQISSEYLYRNEHGENTATKQMIKLTGEMIGKPPFYAQGNATEAGKEKCKAFDLHMNSVNWVYDHKPELFSKPAKPGTKERADQIGEMIFTEYLISTLREAAREKAKIADNFVESVYDRLGLDLSIDPEAKMDVSGLCQFEGAEVGNNYSIYQRTGHEILAGSPEGVETLKKLYMPVIQKSKLYQQLLTAEGDRYDQLLRDIDQETKGGLQSIRGVDIGKPEEKFNEQNATQLSLLNEEIGDRIEDTARMVNRRYFKDINGSVVPGSFAEVLNNIEAQYCISEMNSKQIGIASSGQLKKLKTSFTKLKTYAGTFAEADEITESDVKTYSDYALQVEQNAESILKKADLSKANGAEKILIMLCRRLKFMLPQSREVIAEPVKQRDREANMANWKKDIDKTKDEAFRKAHGDEKYSKEDRLYAGLSKNALTNMHKTRLKILDEQMVGVKYHRKPMIEDAKTATTELTKMILKGEDYIKSHKAQAEKYMLDIMAERVLSRFENAKITLIEAPTYARRFAKTVPEFKDALENLTIGKIGSFVYDNAADKKLRQIPPNKLLTDIDAIYAADLQKNEEIIAKREEERAKKKPAKNVINEIIEEENPDKINEINEEKEPEKEPEKADEEKPKNVEEFIENLSFIEIKIFSDSMYRPDVLPKPEVAQPEVQPVVQPEVQPVVQPVVQPQGMGEADPQPEIPQAEQPSRQQLKSFSDAVHVLNHSRERFIQGLNEIKEIFMRDHPRPAGMTDEEFRQHALQEFGTIGNQQYQDMEIKLDHCIESLSNPNSTPLEMWNNMKQFRMAAAKFAKDNDTWNPFASKIRKDRVRHSKEATLSMRVMMTAMEAAVAPLKRKGFGYGQVTAEDSISTGMRTLYDTCTAAEAKGQELYHMNVMTQQQVHDEYAVLEDLSRERVLIKDACAKRTKSKLNEELYTENKEYLLETKPGYVNTYELASECLVRNYLIRAAESKNAAELRNMREEIRGNVFKRKAEELRQDPTFRDIALRHPNSIFTRWTNIERKINKLKNQSASDLEGFKMRGGVLGVAGYVAYGDGYHDPASEGQKTVRNARLARVITESILKDPKYAGLQRAMAANKLTKADVVIEALNYVENKGIRILDSENRILPEFQRKLENGDFAKDMVNSQKAILDRARTRDPQARANATRQFKLNAPKKKPQNPVLGA